MQTLMYNLSHVCLYSYYTIDSAHEIVVTMLSGETVLGTTLLKDCIVNVSLLQTVSYQNELN